MDSTRVQRLSSVVAIGVATQVSAELMQTESSAHSFWLIVAISLGWSWFGLSPLCVDELTAVYLQG